MAVMTLWPTAVEFVEAVQDNGFAFTDVDLRHGQPIVSKKTGEPLYTSGGFATVCFIQNRANRYAVKFFVNSDSERSQRYAAIGRALSSLRLPYTVSFDFLEAGVDIRGTAYPVVKMEFVKGVLLHNFLEQNLTRPENIMNLANCWVAMSERLRLSGIAHGDLQHRNVFVVNEELKLIDYDGMYVPDLSGEQATELGLPGFQHPGRTRDHFGPYLDNFSDWVMYTTLIALSSDNSLWSLVKVEDQRLLFSKDDYLNPGQSAIFDRLKNSTNSQVSDLATKLESFLSIDVENIPTLSSQISVAPRIQKSTLQSASLVDIFGDVIAPASSQAPSQIAQTQDDEFVPAGTGMVAQKKEGRVKDDCMELFLDLFGLVPGGLYYENQAESPSATRVTGAKSESAKTVCAVIAVLHLIPALVLFLNYTIIALPLFACLLAVYAWILTSVALHSYTSRVFVFPKAIPLNDAVCNLEKNFNSLIASGKPWYLLKKENDAQTPCRLISCHALASNSDKVLICETWVEPMPGGSQVKMRFQGNSFSQAFGFNWWNASEADIFQGQTMVNLIKAKLWSLSA